MKICVFMHRFDDGGAEKTTICLLNELAERGHEITLAIRYNYGPLKKLLSEDIKIIDMKLQENGKLKKNILNVKFLMKLIKSGEFDILVPILSDMSQVTSLAKRLSNSKIPVVSVVHTTISIEKISFPKIRKLLGRFFDKKYNKVVTVSESVRQDYISYSSPDEDKVVTVYNPIVNDKMIELSKERPDHPWLAENRDFVTLLLVGRLNHAKNHPLMFETLKLLRENGDFRLILLGEGEEKEKLQQLVSKMGLSEFVDFHGYVKNPYGYMGFCDCVMLSSHYEGLPTVLVEALVAGARIVSVNCKAGPDEILVGGKYGILTEPGDSKGLADGVIEAMKQNQDREFLLSRAMDFTVEQAVDTYERIFQKEIENAYKN